MNLITDYKEAKPHYKKRILWYVINATVFRIMATRLMRRPRIWLLRLFGACIDGSAIIYPSVRIFAPWNLKLGRCCIGPGVNLYNKASITIGDDTVVSQHSTLCTASHDVSSAMMELVTRPIVLGNRVWVASEAFVGPGVELSDGVVVGARGAVFRSVEAWTVVGGNPARPIGRRQLTK